MLRCYKNISKITYHIIHTRRSLVGKDLGPVLVRNTSWKEYISGGRSSQYKSCGKRPKSRVGQKHILERVYKWGKIFTVQAIF